jgi:hypothetical protein
MQEWGDTGLSESRLPDLCLLARAHRTLAVAIKAIGATAPSFFQMDQARLPIVLVAQWFTICVFGSVDLRALEAGCGV